MEKDENRVFFSSIDQKFKSLNIISKSLRIVQNRGGIARLSKKG